MIELELRFQDPTVSFISPSECVSVGDPDGIPNDQGGEKERYINKIKNQD